MRGGSPPRHPMSDAFISNISKVASILAMWLANGTGCVRRGPDLWLVCALVLTGLHNVGKIKDVDSKVNSLLPKRDDTPECKIVPRLYLLAARSAFMALALVKYTCFSWYGLTLHHDSYFDKSVA